MITNTAYRFFNSTYCVMQLWDTRLNVFRDDDFAIHPQLERTPPQDEVEVALSEEDSEDNMVLSEIKTRNQMPNPITQSTPRTSKNLLEAVINIVAKSLSNKKCNSDNPKSKPKPNKAMQKNVQVQVQVTTISKTLMMMWTKTKKMLNAYIVMVCSRRTQGEING
ncbi:hypothetical protein FQA39_LY19153 [Lamprigera yunnana]|nr:hypothetical protein FQA39_LY19153 [Lamprigera yunnana]